MIIWRILSLANNHQEDLASCKWSFRGSGHLQMIIWRDRPLANDHPEDLASCKWSSGGTCLLQMIIRPPRYPNHLSQDPNSISRTFLEQFALVSAFSCMLFFTVYSILWAWQIITEYTGFWMWGQFLTFFIQECKITLGIIPAKKGPQKLDFSLFRFSQSAIIDTYDLSDNW